MRVRWGFIGAGLYAWWRRPQNNFGPLMKATGFLFYVSEMANGERKSRLEAAQLPMPAERDRERDDHAERDPGGPERQ